MPTVDLVDAEYSNYDTRDKDYPQAENVDEGTAENIELFGRSESPLVESSQSGPDVADGVKEGEH